MAAGTDRIVTLDIVRGVAVMGILTMNIIAFGMPQTAYINPAAYGGVGGVDLLAYLVNFVLFDGKMRGLFSFLFGASMLLVIERAEAKGEQAARIHYARMFWLLLFGLAHLWLVWWGDILAHYAIVGAIAYGFRNLRTAQLIAAGVALLGVQLLVVSGIPLAIIAAEAANPPPELASTLAELQNGFGVPPADYIAAELAVHRSGYGALLAHRFRENVTMPLEFLLFGGWETLAYMLFGMAALRTGMLTGEWDPARYRQWLWVGFGIGIPAYVALAVWMVRNDFSMLSVVLGVLVGPVAVRPPMIVAWAAAIILATRHGGWLVDRIAASGRMAFTNYLVTSLIMTTLFYGYGMGLFGYLSRAELWLPVFGMWALILAWSKPWLARHRYGPFEWLWRSLARGQAQPMRVAVHSWRG